MSAIILTLLDNLENNKVLLSGRTLWEMTPEAGPSPLSDDAVTENW